MNVEATVIDGRRRLRRLRSLISPTIVDAAICVALIAYTIPATTDPSVNGPGTDLDTLLLPAAVLPIMLRRRAPFAAACALALGCVVSGIPTFDQIRLTVAVPAALLIVFSLGGSADRTRALGGLAVVLAGLAFVGATDAVVRDPGSSFIGFIVFSFALCGVIWAAGRLVWSRQLVAEQLRQRSRELERQREQTAALAVEVERLRLAVDLDAAASVPIRTIIELADRDVDPGAAREVFARIERLGRGSLNEMRSLLGVLRSDERGDRAPRPTLAEIDTLLAHARAGGRVVDLRIEGERQPLGPAVELAAYRALQHALSAVRDAAGQPSTVQLRYTPGALQLEVRGLAADGSAPAAALVAARERVTASGGIFSVDSSAAGLRILRAWLPAAATHA